MQLTIPAVVIAVAAMLGFATGSGLALSTASNAPPRLSNLTAHIGRVHLEGGGSKKGGVKGTYRVCDDGPQTSRGRFDLIRITHRWGNQGFDRRLVREQYPSTTWDVYFDKPECRAKIFWSSTIPADLKSVRAYACYSVTLRVRDPGGKWSNVVTRVVKNCR